MSDHNSCKRLAVMVDIYRESFADFSGRSLLVGWVRISLNRIVGLKV